MTTINISLPDAMREWIADQLKGGAYGNASEYIRDLIRSDQKRRAEERLEELLLEGLNSGRVVEVTPDFWAKKKQALVSRAGKRLPARKRSA
jgi:antitoxin ParD1/3/4